MNGQIKKITAGRAAVKNVIHQRFRSVVLLILFAVTAALLFLSSFLSESMGEGIERARQRLGADVIVVPAAYVTNVDNALFLGKPCTVNFERNWIDRIAAVKGVSKVSSQLFLASLGASCCDNLIQLIAFDPETDFSVGPWLSEKGIGSISDDEIIVGRNIRKKPGESVQFFGRHFTVKAVLDETGIGYDSSAFITYGAAYAIAGDPRYKNQLPFSGNRSISAVFVKTDGSTASEGLKTAVAEQYGAAGIRVFAGDELVSRFADTLRDFRIYGKMLMFLFFVFAGTALFALSAVTVQTRSREFGNMLTAGIRKTQIFRMLFTETALLAGTGSTAGFVSITIFLRLFDTHLKELFAVPYVLPDVYSMTRIVLEMSAAVSVLYLISLTAQFVRINNMEPVSLVHEVNG